MPYVISANTFRFPVQQIMKVYSWFFIIISLAELVFSAGYVLLRMKWDKILLWGFLIYLIAMMAGYISLRIERYNKKKKALLDSLPE